MIMHDYAKVCVTSRRCVRVSLGALMEDFTLCHVLLVRFGACTYMYSGYHAPFSTLLYNIITFKLTVDWVWVFRPAVLMNH